MSSKQFQSHGGKVLFEGFARERSRTRLSQYRRPQAARLSGQSAGTAEAGCPAESEK